LFKPILLLLRKGDNLHDIQRLRSHAKACKKENTQTAQDLHRLEQKKQK